MNIQEDNRHNRIRTYVDSILTQDSYEHITKPLSVPMTARTSLIIKKLAHVSGKTEKEIAGKLLDIAVEEAYKISMDKIEIDEEEVKRYAEQIKSANRRKGKKRSSKKRANTIVDKEIGVLSE